MAIECFHRFFGGSGPVPLVILHGLLGSSRNWGSAARDLAAHLPVYLLDARNHGESPWAESCTYEDMAEDVVAWAQCQGFTRFYLLGHSMGGKTAMRLACSFPRLLQGLIVADIAPVASASRWEKPFAVLDSVRPEDFKDRAEADAALAEGGVDNAAFRGFLLTNLARRAEGGFRWQANVSALRNALPTLFNNPLQPGEHFGGPVQVLRGERSDFLPAEKVSAFAPYFPNYQETVVTGAGHNLHIDNRPAFVSAVSGFIAENQ
jgi:esterase